MGGWWLANLPLADSSFGSGPALLAGALAAGAVLLILVGASRAITGRVNSVTHRLDEFIAPAGAPAEPGALAALGKRSRREKKRRVGANASADANASTYSLKVARALAQADLRITVGEFLVVSAILASVGALIGFALPLGGHFILGFALLFAGWYGPRLYVNRKRNQRLDAFNGQLADMLGLMSGALRSGYSLLQAMELSAREGPEPAGPEFDRVVREIGFGLSPEEALNNLVTRMESEELVLMVTALNVQREVGGNLVEVLESIANTIRERTKLLGEVKVLTAQQEISGYVIALLPVGLTLILLIINPSYMLSVFQETTWCGWTMVGCSAIMILTGFLIIRRIVNIKV
jgi:tight adherence protein B